MTTRTTYAGVTVPTADAASLKKLKTLTNFATNPRAGVDISNWIQGDNGGTPTTPTLSRVATGGPLANSPTFVRKTWGAVIPTSVSNLSHYGTVENPLSAGVTYRLSSYLRCSKAVVQVQAVLSFWNGGGQISAVNAIASLAANTWTLAAISGLSPAGTTRALLQFGIFQNPSAQGIVAGDTFDVSAIMLNDTSAAAAPSFADGDSTGWTWSGTAGKSTSSGLLIA